MPTGIPLFEATANQGFCRRFASNLETKQEPSLQSSAETHTKVLTIVLDLCTMGNGQLQLSLLCASSAAVNLTEENLKIYVGGGPLDASVIYFSGAIKPISLAGLLIYLWNLIAGRGPALPSCDPSPCWVEREDSEAPA